MIQPYSAAQLFASISHYLLTKSLLLGKKWVSEHQYLQTFSLKLIKYE